MLVSTKGRYALRVMLELTRHDTGAFIPLPERYPSLIYQRLSQQISQHMRVALPCQMPLQDS